MATALNLDEIFGDVVFTPDGDTVLLSEEQDVLNSAETAVTTGARKMRDDGKFEKVSEGGGLYTTNLYDPSKPSLVMGKTEEAEKKTEAVPFKTAPQKRNHIQYAVPKAEKKDRRDREEAKRNRRRKKLVLESLNQSVSLLKEENEKLRNVLKAHLGEAKANSILDEGEKDPGAAKLLAASQGAANKVLDDPDFGFIKSLQTAQQNFVVTDPSLPDNPIVYASQGFLNLTGYSLDQILGRNCRFLQGPETDPKAVEKIRKSIEAGHDMSVCLLNYRVDGTTFWNQFFIAPLRDAAGNVTNFVGVQCKVSDQYAATVTHNQEEEAEA